MTNSSTLPGLSREGAKFSLVLDIFPNPVLFSRLCFKPQFKLREQFSIHTMTHGERLIFVDVETAGLKTAPSIVQIAAIAIDAELNEVESFETKVRFESTKIDQESFEPTLWKRMANQPEKAAEEFASFLRRHATVDMVSKAGRPYQLARLAAHNSSFDCPLLERWYRDLDLFYPAARSTFCTLQRAYWLFEEDKSLAPPADYKLTTLCEYFGIALHRADVHNAVADVQATVKLYRAIVDLVHFEDDED